ncbi:hypothetical protein BDR05DRAFT_969882 [Suillus weaverae]|nr:hypothetical protein BDR05DRAFT_969882 [Suillus weaverae]
MIRGKLNGEDRKLCTNGVVDLASALQALDGSISSTSTIIIWPPSSPARSSSNSMTLVSNDPSWWPVINANFICSYFVVVGCAGIIYGWVLTLGQEVGRSISGAANSLRFVL